MPYPLRELPMLLSLSAVLAVVSAVTLLSLPRVLQGNLATVALNSLILPLCLWSVVPLLVLGHASLFLSRVTAYAVAGEVKHVGWPDLDPGPPLQNLGRWIGCVLCGPVPAAWVSLWYWLRCGVMGPLDWLLVAELLLPATGYWLVGLLLTSSSDRWNGLNPAHVIAAIIQLGSRAMIGAMLGFSVLFVHLLLGWRAIEVLHRNWLSGSLLLALCWFSALYSGTFVLRLFGLWYHHALRHAPPSATPRWAIPGLEFAPAASAKRCTS